MTTTGNESPRQYGSVKPTALATNTPRYQGQDMENHRAWIRAEGAMLEALRQGLPITTGFLDPPDMVHHGGERYFPRRPAAITWTFLTTEQGCEELWSHIVSASGQYGPIIHPSEPDMTLDDTETAENDLANRIDHLLSAIQAEWEIAIYRTPDGLGIITWDRQSHGNHPAIVVDQDRNVCTYYELPNSLRAGYKKAETTGEGRRDAQTLVREAVEAADWYEGIHSGSKLT